MWHLISLDYFLCSIEFIYYAFTLKLGFLIWKFHLTSFYVFYNFWLYIAWFHDKYYFNLHVHYTFFLSSQNRNLLLIWTLPCKILEIHENYLEIAYTTTCPLRMIDKRRQLNKYFIWNNILDLRTLIFMLKCKQWFSLLSSFDIHAL